MMILRRATKVSNTIVAATNATVSQQQQQSVAKFTTTNNNKTQRQQRTQVNLISTQQHNFNTWTQTKSQTTTICKSNVNQISSRSFSSYPAHTELRMPALSPTMEKGNIATWNKKEGDQISAGEVLAEVETDKATVGWESTDAGYIAKILLPAGTQDVKLGQLAAIMVEEASDVAAFANYTEGGAAPAAAKAPAAPTAANTVPPVQAAPVANATPATPAPAPAAPTPVAQQAGVFATPLARRLASERSIDVKTVSGSGPNSRVVAADVLEFKAAVQPVFTATTTAAASIPAPTPAATGEYEDIPHSNVRKVIAQRLTQSKQTIPHYYLTMDCNVDELMKVRAHLNGKYDLKISVNDFILKASALALRKVPMVNASWLDNAIRKYNYVDVSVAVSTDRGLITPIIKDADIKGLETISKEMKSLAAKARDNKLQPHEFQGGTFTVSNLGMFGIKHFAAIINPPQSCILAVGTADARVIPNEGADKETKPFKTGKFISVTASCDHRVVDGALGAEFLQAFKGYMEDPVSMML